MIKLSDRQKKDMYDLLKEHSKQEETPADVDDAMFLLWEFLEGEGFQYYEIQEFITQKGDWVKTRALLMELTNL